MAAAVTSNAFLTHNYNHKRHSAPFKTSFAQFMYPRKIQSEKTSGMTRFTSQQPQPIDSGTYCPGPMDEVDDFSSMQRANTTGHSHQPQERMSNIPPSGTSRREDDTEERTPSEVDAQVGTGHTISPTSETESPITHTMDLRRDRPRRYSIQTIEIFQNEEEARSRLNMLEDNRAIGNGHWLNSNTGRENTCHTESSKSEEKKGHQGSEDQTTNRRKSRVMDTLDRVLHIPGRGSHHIATSCTNTDSRLPVVSEMRNKSWCSETEVQRKRARGSVEKITWRAGSLFHRIRRQSRREDGHAAPVSE